MEKALKSNKDKEFMRIAMLKHEETFRQQVNELHRLYCIQKMLMENSGLNHQQQQQQKLQQERYNLVESSKAAFTIDHYQQQFILQQAQIQRDMMSNANNINDKSKIMGLSLMRPNNNINQVRGPRSSGAQEHIAESNDDARLDESEIELTLSLGPSSFNPRRQKMGRSESGRSISSSSTGSSQTKKTNTKKNDNRMITTTWGSFPQGSGIEPGFSSAQQSNNPPWLYQALSLKLT